MKRSIIGREPSILHFLENKLNWKTKHPQLQWKGLQPTKMGQLIWSFEFALPLGTFTHGGALESKVCLGEGRLW